MQIITQEGIGKELAMNSMTEWRTKDPWTWREFALLLLLEFIFVMAGVKYGAESLYQSWLDDSLYSGTLTGLTIAIVLLTGLYLLALRPKHLPWAEVGLSKFQAKDGLRIIIWVFVLIALSVAVMLLTSLLGNDLNNSKTENDG